MNMRKTYCYRRIGCDNKLSKAIINECPFINGNDLPIDQEKNFEVTQLLTKFDRYIYNQYAFELFSCSFLFDASYSTRRKMSFICGFTFIALSVIGMVSSVLVVPYTDGTKINKLSFSVSLKFFDHELQTYTHFCGGSIIGDQWIITSANCMKPAEFTPAEIFVVVGADGIKKNERGYPVKQILKHPAYQRVGLLTVADLALIETFDEIGFNVFVQPIPISAKEISENFADVFAAAQDIVRIF